MTPDEKLKTILITREKDWSDRLDSLTDLQAAKLSGMLDEVADEMLFMIDHTRGALTDKKTLALLGDIELANVALAKKLGAKTISIASAMGALAYKEANAILSFDNKIPGWNTSGMSKEQIKALMQTISPYNKDVFGVLKGITSRQLKDEILRDIGKGRIKGDSYKDLYERIKTGYGLSKKELLSVLKTYVHTANTKAHDKLFNDNKDIVKRVQWTATMEKSNRKSGRGTCLNCAMLDGNIYLLKAIRPPCPLHPNCRCIYLPVLPTFKELGFDMEEIDTEYRVWYERPDQIIGTGGRDIFETGYLKGNYKDYWKMQFDKHGEQYALDTLGKGRWQLINSGKIGLSDLIDDKTGRLKLIAELQ